jgi:hypothetical protein
MNVLLYMFYSKEATNKIYARVTKKLVRTVSLFANKKLVDANYFRRLTNENAHKIILNQPMVICFRHEN